MTVKEFTAIIDEGYFRIIPFKERETILFQSSDNNYPPENLLDKEITSISATQEIIEMGNGYDDILLPFIELYIK